MKVTIKKKQEIEIKTLEVKAKVRYWEDAKINGKSNETGDLVPCKNGLLWCPVIDIDTGIIKNWEPGKKAEIHFKVCDCGSYFLKDANGKTILSIENDYVPEMLCPKKNGYGDYIIMDILENGQIKNWKLTLDDFETD